MSREDISRRTREDGDRWATAPRGLPKLSVKLLQRHHDTIAEESQSQESQGLNSDRHKQMRRASAGLINLALVSELDSMSMGSPIETPSNRRQSMLAFSSNHFFDHLLSRGSTLTPKHEESGSVLSSEGMPKHHRDQDAESSSYNLTPKDTEQDQSSFDSRTLSIIDETGKRKLTQRLNIPKKTSPARSIDSIRSVARQEDYLKDFASYHATFSDEDITHAFEELDLDQNGFLTTEEIRSTLDGIGEYVSDEVVDEMIRMLDVEGRGQIAFEEFYRMATGQSTAPIGGALPPNPTMKIAGMNQISWKKVGGNRTQRSATAASIDSQVKSTLPKKADGSPQSSMIRKPLRTFDIVPNKTASKVKKLSVGLPGKGSKSHFPPPVAIPEEPARPPATPPISTLSPRDSECRTLLSHDSHLRDDHERTILVSDLVHTTVFTSQTIERLVDIFANTTGSDGGELDYNQFLAMVNARLQPGAQLEDDRLTKRMFMILDTDKSHALSVREFVQGLSNLRRPKDEEQSKFVYRVFDADDDGTISKNELIRILKLNTHSIHTDAQAFAKAEEILNLAGDAEQMTLEGFMKLREKKLMLFVPVQERARKMVFIANIEEQI